MAMVEECNLSMRKNKQELSYFERQTRADILAELGSILCELRQKQSISIEQIATKTGIMRRQLLAIELGELDRLPEPIYIQYFIKRYAEVLGLNGTEFASAFPTDRYLIPPIPPWIYLPVPQLRPIHLYFLYIFVIFVSLNGLSYIIDHPLNQNNILYVQQPDEPQISLGIANRTTPETSSSAPAEQSKKATPVAHRRSDFSGPEPVRVTMTMDADSWLWIEADGKTEFEGILPKGSERTWVASQQLIIRAGNAGGVRIALNDGLLRKLGEPNVVEEVTFKVPPRSRI